MSLSIPKDFIQQLLATVDIVQVISERVALKKKGSTYVACCPFHQEKTPSFNVNARKQFYYCFGCGAGGDAISFIKAYDHLDFVEAVEKLAHRYGKEVPRAVSDQPSISPSHYALMDKACQYYQKNLKHSPEAIDYLKTRGLTGHSAKEFKLGCVLGKDDDFFQACLSEHTKADMQAVGLLSQKDRPYFYGFRLMFPIRDTRGRVIAFGARSLTDAMPKYLNSPETPLFHKSHTLYGLYEALVSTRQLQRLIVVEGYMDVVALTQHGIPGAVATLGTACTQAHIQKLLKYVKDIIFAFDGDGAGKKAAWKALEHMVPLVTAGTKFQFMTMPSGQDPDSYVNAYGKDAFEALMGQAKEFSDYFFSELMDQYWGDALADQARFAQQALSYIERMPRGVYRQMLLTKLEGKSGQKFSEMTEPVPTKQAGLRVPLKRSRFRFASPAYHAVALLLHKPSLLSESLPFCSPLLSGHHILMRVSQCILDNQSLTCAQIIDLIGKDHEEILLKLASWEPVQGDDEVLGEEWLAVMAKIKSESLTKTINALISKKKKSGLSDQESSQLALLIRSKRLDDGND